MNAQEDDSSSDSDESSIEEEPLTPNDYPEFDLGCDLSGGEMAAINVKFGGMDLLRRMLENSTRISVIYDKNKKSLTLNCKGFEPSTLFI
jgi:hypothetical protein